MSSSIWRDWREEVFLGILSLEHLDTLSLAWGLQAVAAQLEVAGKRVDEEAAQRKRLSHSCKSTGSSGLKSAAGMLKDMQAGP